MLHGEPGRFSFGECRAVGRLQVRKGRAGRLARATGAHFSRPVPYPATGQPNGADASVRRYLQLAIGLPFRVRRTYRSCRVLKVHCRWPRALFTSSVLGRGRETRCSGAVPPMPVLSTTVAGGGRSDRHRSCSRLEGLSGVSEVFLSDPS